MSMQAKLTIEVDAAGKMGMSFQGNEECMLMLIGSMDVVKTDFIHRLQQRPDFRSSWNVPAGPTVTDLHAPKHNQYAAEQRVPKDVALQRYYEAMETLRSRIQKISETPEGSHWVINPVALSSL